jgi:hypothetical protein
MALTAMKKEARILLDKAIASLIISVEHFNRPSDLGRVDAVLILMDHAFEMLLKAAILHRGGRIREPRAKMTIGFDHSVRVGLSDGAVRFLTEEDALLIQTNNGLRDAAQHHLLDISEQHLYIQAQAGLTLFRKLLSQVFGKELGDALPARVLPLCTVVPTDLTTLFDNEISEIKTLLKPGTRHRIEAIAKLRALAIVDASLSGQHVQPSQSELAATADKLKEGKIWQGLFPGVASINIVATGEGPSIALRITKTDGAPITLVKEGTPGASVVAVKRVNELDYYSLGAGDLSEKAKINSYEVLAVIHHLRIQEDSTFYKPIRIGSQTYKRYSMMALDSVVKCVREGHLSEAVVRYRKFKKDKASKEATE